MNASSAREPNLDPREVAHFATLAGQWWDADGESRTLHDINPCRLDYLLQHTTLTGRRVLDVGCGGGLLTEALARAGALASGLDATAELIEVASNHAKQSGLDITYHTGTCEDWAGAHPGKYQLITCMELLEHVPEPGQLLHACRALLTDDGELFLSTLNRTPRAYGMAILGAEYLLRLLPRGTHDYRRFIRPSELARSLREAGFEVESVAGMHYDPFTRRARLTADPGVNYLLKARVRA